MRLEAWEAREAMWDKQTKRSASEPWIIKDRRGVTVVGDLVRETEKFLTVRHSVKSPAGEYGWAQQPVPEPR